MAQRKVGIDLVTKLSPQGKRALMKIKMSVKRIGASAKRALNFGTHIAAGATAATAALAMMVKKSIEVGDNLDKMSKRTGLTVEFLVGLGHAADQGGSSMEAMEKAVKKLSQSASDANDGLKTYTRQFDALGVSIHDTEGKLKPTEQLFLETADALSKMENNTQKVAVASKIFGRAGTSLLPMLTNGKNGIRAMIQESKALGNVWNNQTTSAAASASDAMARVWKIAGNLRDRMSVELIPEVTAAADATRDWFMANKEAINGEIVKFTSRLSTEFKNGYTILSQWAQDGSFSKWWAQAKAGATGLWVVITSIKAALANVNAGLAKLADIGFKLNPMLHLVKAFGVDTSADENLITSYRQNAEAGAMSANKDLKAALSSYSNQANEVAAGGIKTDNYHRRGAGSADAMQQAADQAVGAFQAGQDQRLRENSARLRMMGS